MANLDSEAGGSRFPFLQGILPIIPSRVPADLVAGLTLAALNIPQAMGYTRIAGTPVITGLYAILIPMALFALFGSSRHLVVGADSATAAILAAGLTGLAVMGSPEYVALCGLLALMAAGFLLIARLIGLGFLADFLSRTVLVGFLTGVGIQVSLGQIAGMLGLPHGGTSPVEHLIHALQHLHQTNYHTLTMAAAVLAIILGFRKISRRIPGAFIAVTGAIVVSWAIGLSAHGVAVLGAVPSGLPKFGLPQVHLSVDLVMTLLPSAFSIFVVILAQSAATSRAFAACYNERFSENRDLVGLSLANFGAGLSGAFVVNGSPTATEMVNRSGGRSQLAQITSSVITLLVLLFLTGPLAYLPRAVLSAVVFLICIDLIDIKGMRGIYRERPAEFWVALFTTATVVLVGVEEGILLAMFLSLVSHTRHGYRPKNALIVPAEPEGWKAQPLEAPAQILPGLLIYRFSHGMYYANAELLFRQVTTLADKVQPPLAWFCINAAAVDDVDFTAAATLRSLYAALKERGIKLVFIEVSNEVMAQLARSGLIALIGPDAFYAHAGELMQTYKTYITSGEPK